MRVHTVPHEGSSPTVCHLTLGACVWQGIEAAAMRLQTLAPATPKSLTEHTVSGLSVSKWEKKACSRAASV
ncbi:unnamed protein product [Mesocestoides corti]|uniref:Uncharacterized protein n=1 Tax=Mesocestoides corti TaxID=53468 RepID=A0A158QST3_MESCO|nr:unnamed protein product [Mesocestoides corti]